MGWTGERLSFFLSPARLESEREEETTQDSLRRPGTGRHSFKKKRNERARKKLKLEKIVPGAEGFVAFTHTHKHRP